MDELEQRTEDWGEVLKKSYEYPLGAREAPPKTVIIVDDAKSAQRVYGEILTAYNGKYKTQHIVNEPTQVLELCTTKIKIPWKPGSHLKHVAKTIKYYSECASHPLMSVHGCDIK